MPQPSHGTGRIPALDGLRGIAVALVLSEHFFRTGFAGAWFGVDMFFALSGFLITTILLAEREEQHFWRIFYTRRATRILPPFVLLLCGCAFLPHFDWRHLWPYLFFTLTNYAFQHQTGAIIGSSVAALWSLSVEEHFYFLWPVQVRNFPRRVMVAVLLAILVLEPVLRSIAVRRGATELQVYFQTPYRLDGLALGSLFALGMAHPPSRAVLQRIIPWIAPVVLLTFLLHPVASAPLSIHVAALYYSLSAITGALVVAFVAIGRSALVGRALSLPPLVFLGRISYGLYLYHFPLYMVVLAVAFKLHIGGRLALALFSLALSIALSWLSFRYIETPSLNYGRRQVMAFRFREEAAVEAMAQATCLRRQE